jgi:hypothetical protein
MIGFRVGFRLLTRVKSDRGRDRGDKLSFEWNCDFGVGVTRVNMALGYESSLNLFMR